MTKRRANRTRKEREAGPTGEIAKFMKLTSASEWPKPPTEPGEKDQAAKYPCYTCVTSTPACHCAYKTGTKCYTCVCKNLPCNIDGRIPERDRFKANGEPIRPHRSAAIKQVYKERCVKGKRDKVYPVKSDVKLNKRALAEEFPPDERSPELTELLQAAFEEKADLVVIDPSTPRRIVDIAVPKEEKVAIKDCLKLAARALRCMDFAEAASRYYRSCNELFGWERSDVPQLAALRIPSPREYVAPTAPREQGRKAPSAKAVESLFRAGGDMSDDEAMQAEDEWEDEA